MHENLLLAFSMTLLAGLSTGIGSAMAFFTKRTNTRFLSVSLDGLFPTARKYGRGHLAIYGLIAGMAIMALSLLLL